MTTRISSGTSDQPESQFPSLEIVFDLTKSRLDSQLAHVDSLDAKANFVLGSATLLTAAATTLRSAATHLPQWLDLAVATAAVLLYLAVVFAVYRAYTTRDYYYDPSPVSLERYMWADTARTRGVVLANMVDSFSRNVAIIKKKAFWARWSLRAFMAEAVLLALFAFLQVLN